MLGPNLSRGDPKRGEVKNDAIWQAGKKQRSKTFEAKGEAEKYLTKVVSVTQDGNYVHVAPIPMGEVFDKWLEHSLALRRKQGLLKPSTAKSYTSMVKIHLRPAFEHVRSDRLSLASWGSGSASWRIRSRRAR
jgi:hypothetical protein